MENRPQEIRKRRYLTFARKIIAVSRNEWLKAFFYRVSILSFRLGEFVQVAFNVIIWTAIFRSAAEVGGYDYPQMMTYIVVGYLFALLSDNYVYEANISRLIHDGRLSNIMVKPISFLGYIVSAALGRVSVTIFSSSFMLLPIIIFWNRLLPPSGFLPVLIILAILIISYFVKLFLSILIGMIAFWFIQVSGFQSSFRQLEKMLSGSYFPINILPLIYVKISLFFPFAYTFFVPMQIYLGKMGILEGFISIGVISAWLLALYGIIKLVYKMGLKKYESVGI